MDSTGALQVMVSRPLVVGGITGLVLGCLAGAAESGAATGLAAGGLVELLWIGGLPVGSVVPPDGVSAAMTAAAAAVLLRNGGAGEAAAAIGVLASIPVGALGARAEVIQRLLTARLSARAECAVERGEAVSVGGLLAAALGLAWLRGVLVCALCLGLGIPALGWILGHLPLDGVRALKWCFWLFWLLGLAVAADHFWERRGLKYAAGLALVLAILGTQYDVSQQMILSLAVAGAAAAGLWRWAHALRGEE